MIEELEIYKVDIDEVVDGATESDNGVDEAT